MSARFLLFAAILSALLAVGVLQRTPSSVELAVEAEPPLWTARSEPIVPLVPLHGVDPGLAELGRKLFHDPRLSRDGSVSCASCHDIEAGGDDGRALSVGIDGELGHRNSPTVLNAAHNFRQFWDGRARDLEEQAEGPLLSPVEMGWASWDDLLAALENEEDLLAASRAVDPGGPSRETILSALVAFQSTLITLDSPFDRWLAGDNDALTEDALKGYRLFKRTGCVVCHQGQNVGGNMFQRVGRLTFADEEGGDAGRMALTGKESDRSRFKVPGLRNVELTAPYMHDGSIPTLPEAVQYMAHHQLGDELTSDEVSSIVSFLESLTGHIEPAWSE